VVWVNGMYVTRWHDPPDGTVTVPADRFYAAMAACSHRLQPGLEVEIVSGSEVVNTLGPVVEQ